jgi:hypothetical protein
MLLQAPRLQATGLQGLRWLGVLLREFPGPGLPGPGFPQRAAPARGLLLAVLALLVLLFLLRQSLPLVRMML